MAGGSALAASSRKSEIAGSTASHLLHLTLTVRGQQLQHHHRRVSFVPVSSILYSSIQAFFYQDSLSTLGLSCCAWGG